ncbi:uncharacterized protein TNCV_4332301 [Trichonephila clavipes]|nr:uncharacterized protein TNCV_4332301 [Trichonephila clavipes]
MRQDQYKDVLQNRLIPQLEEWFPNGESYIFMQDGTPCHTARSIKAFLAGQNILLLDWPGNSPDMNTIENVWVLELLESLPFESSDSPTDEEVPANNLLEFSLDSEEHDEEIEQDPGCISFYSEITAFPNSGCNKSKMIRLRKKRDVQI